MPMTPQQTLTGVNHTAIHHPYLKLQESTTTPHKVHTKGCNTRQQCNRRSQCYNIVIMEGQITPRTGLKWFELVVY
jgi:hypothetical protein